PTASLDLFGFRWQTLWQLHDLIGRHRIGLVHWNFYPPVNGYVLSLSALRPRVQHYFTDHNSRLLPLPAPPRWPTRWVRQALLRRFRKVWCVSQFVRDCLAEQRSWSNLERCLHFINTDRFRPDSATRQQVRREHGVEDRFVVLSVANLITEKRIDVAIRALVAAPERVTWWVVGRGKDGAEWPKTGWE